MAKDLFDYVHMWIDLICVHAENGKATRKQQNVFFFLLSQPGYFAESQQVKRLFCGLLLFMITHIAAHYSCTHFVL